MVIELLKAENRALEERLKGHRIVFIDPECALLAREAKPLSRKELAEWIFRFLPLR